MSPHPRTPRAEAVTGLRRRSRKGEPPLARRIAFVHNPSTLLGGVLPPLRLPHPTEDLRHENATAPAHGLPVPRRAAAGRGGRAGGLPSRSPPWYATPTRSSPGPRETRSRSPAPAWSSKARNFGQRPSVALRIAGGRAGATGRRGTARSR